MRWQIVRTAVDRHERVALRAVADELKRLEPFPGHIHPVYGDLRPQRLPASCWPTPPAELAFIVERCQKLLPMPLQASENYFLDYPVGTQMHPHIDPGPPRGDGSFADHWRVGILLELGEGGTLVLDGERMTLDPGDAYVFKASAVTHAIEPITAGRRLVWTSGFND